MDFWGHIALSTKLSLAEAWSIATLDRGSETKVSNFEIEFFVVKQIFGLQISMSNAVAVDIIQTINKLSEIETAYPLIESSTSGNVIEELTTSSQLKSNADNVLFGSI